MKFRYLTRASIIHLGLFLYLPSITDLKLSHNQTLDGSPFDLKALIYPYIGYMYIYLDGVQVGWIQSSIPQKGNKAISQKMIKIGVNPLKEI